MILPAATGTSFFRIAAHVGHLIRKAGLGLPFAESFCESVVRVGVPASFVGVGAAGISFVGWGAAGASFVGLGTAGASFVSLMPGGVGLGSVGGGTRKGFWHLGHRNVFPAGAGSSIFRRVLHDGQMSWRAVEGTFAGGGGFVGTVGTAAGGGGFVGAAAGAGGFVGAAAGGGGVVGAAGAAGAAEPFEDRGNTRAHFGHLIAVVAATGTAIFKALEHDGQTILVSGMAPLRDG